MGQASEPSHVWESERLDQCRIVHEIWAIDQLQVAQIPTPCVQSYRDLNR